MKAYIIIITAFVSLSIAAGFVAKKGIEKISQEKGKVEYKIVRDTILIDRGRSDCSPWYQYQVELGQDSIYVWNGQRLVAVMHYKESNIDSLLIKDNE
jgi:hypothetical protein